MTTLNDIRDAVERECQQAESQRAAQKHQTEQLGRRIVQNADTLGLIQLRLMVLAEGLEPLLEQVEATENVELTLPTATMLDHNLIQALMAHAPLASILNGMVPKDELEAFLEIYTEESAACDASACETVVVRATEETVKAAQVTNIAFVEPICACRH